MRRSIIIIMLVASFAVTSQLAAAQDEPVPATVDDFVCEFSGECPDEAAPEANANGDRPRVSATRGFALSGTGSGTAQPRGTPRRPGAAPTAARRPVAGHRVNLRLSFETGSATLTAVARAQAQVFAQSLQRPQLASMRFQIEGHTDSVGSRQSNVALSQRRAQSVADFLVGAGVGRARLAVRGYGPDRPIAGTRASDGRNRRVEAVRLN